MKPSFQIAFLLLVPILQQCKVRSDTALSAEADQEPSFVTKRYPLTTRSGIQAGIIYNTKAQVICRGLCKPGQATCEAELQSLTLKELSAILNGKFVGQIVAAFSDNPGNADFLSDLGVAANNATLVAFNKAFQDRYEQMGIVGTHVCRDGAGNLTPNPDTPMQELKSLLGDEVALQADKVEAFFTNYPNIAQSVDDFVSLLPRKSLGKSMMKASEAMCADAVQDDLPRVIVNSGDAVLAFNGPGKGECSNLVELIKVKNREKADPLKFAKFDTFRGDPDTKQSYDFSLIEMGTNKHAGGFSTK